MELTPDQKLARHKKVIRKFKALVRLVIANLYWLGEIGDQQLTTNVRKNIRLLLRRKTIRSPLTIKEKGILSKPKEERTEGEKDLLRKAIGGLKCFRKYPEPVKARLAGVTYFVYYGPDRDIVRQSHSAEAMYFLVTGECHVTIKHYDSYLKEWIVEESGTLSTGMMFGEISLLHGIQRLATITTKTNCELLMVKKEDFDSILKDTVLKSWNDLRKIIDQFSYFDIWNQFIKRECVIVARMNSYKSDETLLGDGSGFPKHAYFIVSGNCCVLQQLTVKLIMLQGLAHYELVEDDEDTSTEAMSTSYFRKFYQRKYSETGSKVSTMSRSTTYSRHRESVVSESHKKGRISRATISSLPSQSLTLRSGQSTHFQGVEVTDKEKNQLKNWSTRVSIETTLTQRVRYEEDHRDIFDDEYDDLDEIVEDPLPRKSRMASFYIPKIKVEHHFIKICEYVKNTCFNIGENMTRKRVLALTPVTCLLVPLDFIRKNNIGNMFDGVKRFLEHHIPNTQKVFKRFVNEQKFKKYGKQLVRELLNEKMIKTNNSIHNVPYSIRLNQGLDTEYFEF